MLGVVVQRNKLIALVLKNIRDESILLEINLCFGVDCVETVSSARASSS